MAGQGHATDLATWAARAIVKQVGYQPQAQHHKTSQNAPINIALPEAKGNFGECQENFANGEPPVLDKGMASKARALCFQDFAVMHSGITKTALYSAEVLSRDRLQAAKDMERTDEFFADARIPSAERATLEDYKGSGFDRGHSSPAGDRHDMTAMAQSFSLANMVPQSPVNNRKAWADIEKATRAYAMRAQDRVYVITGSVYDKQQCPVVLAAQRALESKNIPLPPDNNPKLMIETAANPKFQTGFQAPRRFNLASCSIGQQVAIPSHLYKLVYDPKTQRAWAHWLANTDWAQVGKPITYAELVERTGIEFLPGISPRN